MRGWEGRELLNSIYYCGQYRPLPMSLNENPDISFTGDTLYYPDGSLAKAVSNEDGEIISLRFTRDTAPADLSVYGIGFGAAPDDVPHTVGIANTVSGSEEQTIRYSYYGGGITELTFIFEEKKLQEIYIAI